MQGFNPYDYAESLMRNSDKLIISLLVCLVIVIIVSIIRRIHISNQVKSLANNAIEMTPEEFMKMRSAKTGQRYYALTKNYPGVYILFNKTKNKFYVGQGKQVLNRVNAHFTGHGNGDVYADYKYGDSFTIRTIKLEGSGFNNLNDLERYFIKEYNAFSLGYNKTRGNRK